MRKKLYFLTLAALASMPILAQDQPEGPVRTANDAKEIFFQGFEEDYETWSTTPVDSIVGMTYYDTQSKPDAYSVLTTPLYPTVRDTTMLLYNGVKMGSADDVAAGGYDEDEFAILMDPDGDFSRQKALEQYGIDAGQYYFKYHAGDYLGSKETQSSGNLPNYRRNLLIRNLPIEDESSYRITMYLKVEELGSSSTKFYADLMRGGSNSDCSFSMGYDDDPDNYLYDNEFAFETSSFIEGWNKITFMTYYLGDEAAERFMYSGKYNSGWASNWAWKPNPNEDKTLQYVVQPDKFFVRLSFVSDSTNYYLDNLSLTKSWIGGVEHYKDIMRVDFGYDTDMDQICAKEKAESNIDAVEVPGNYFEVWGLDHDTQEWFDVEIASAEYHADGYMYMWTKPFVENGIEYPNEFEGYDSVLVSFRNPVDNEKLCLHYDGELFPKALDVEWIKDGKKLPDFTNEISTMNPHIGENVSSLKNLPPVIQSMPWEDGSFGLDGSVRELTFNFSKQLDYDNIGEQSTKAFLRVTKSGVKEIWTVKEATTTYVTFQRPASTTGNLDGEYLFEILNIKGLNTNYSDNISFTWEFGNFDLNPSNEVVLKTNWSSEVSETGRPIPTSLVVWNDKDGFVFGDGTNDSSRGNWLYLTNPNPAGYDCGMFMSARNKGKNTNGNVYMGLVDPIHVKPGKYSISFICGTRDKTAKTILSYFKYSIMGKSEEDIEADITGMVGSDKTVNGKTLIAEFTPTQIHPESQWDSKKWPDNYDSYSFNFEITEESDYVFDFTIENVKGNYGPVISDVTIKPIASISAPYVSAFNKALENAKARQAQAKADVKYQGAQFDEFSKLIESYEGWQNTAPSKYNETVSILSSGTKTMELRIDKVDLFNEHYGMVADKLAEFDGTENSNLKTVQALQQLYNDNAGFDFTATSATNDRLTEIIQSFDDGIDAVDARLANMELFTAKLTQINNQLNDSTSQTGFDEFAQMQNVYDQYKDADLVTPTDEELAQMYDAICDGYNGYTFKIQYIEAMTRRIKELYALDDLLGWDFNGQKDDIQATVEALQDNDEQLEAMLETAAKYMILKSFSEGKTLEGTDVSALIPNYFTYAAAEGAADMEPKDDFYRIVRSKDVTSVFPYWTVNYSSGSVYPGNEKLDWSRDAHTFIAGLFTEVNTTCEMQGDDLTTLPAAYYKVSANFGTNNVSNSKFTIYVDGEKVIDKTLSKKSGATTYSYDSILVNNATMALKYKLSGASGSNNVHFTGVGLAIDGPVEGVAYDEAATELKTELDAIVTFVDGPASAAQSQYFGLDGRMIDAPKAGQIAIRRTTLGNGKAAVEKILVK